MVPLDVPPELDRCRGRDSSEQMDLAPMIIGVPTFFPTKIPAKVQERSQTGLSRACNLVACEQKRPSAGNFLC